MTAQDNLNPQQFYHGTESVLHKGDTIVPGHGEGHFNMGSREHTFFTANKLNASYYADYAVGTHWDEPEAQAKMKPHVYKVEPTGPYEPDPADNDAGNEQSYRSKSPLRVVGHAKYNPAYGPAL